MIMKLKNSKKGKKRKEWELLNKKKSVEGKVNKWILDNLQIHRTGLSRLFPSIGKVGIMINLPHGLPMTDSEIVDGRAILGGNFEHYRDSWRIVCVRTMSDTLAIIVLIDGTNSTEIKRKSYEKGFNWNEWLKINYAFRKDNLDGYYLICHEEKRGMYLGYTWGESLVILNELFRLSEKDF